MTAESLFCEALTLSPEERAAFLDRACAGDEGLRRQVEALLRAHDRPDHLLDRPAVTLDHGPPEAAAGQVIAGRYKLLEAIGEGGMGTVWVAEQTEPVRRKVALKLIKPGMDSKAVLARFEAERQALALMDHPGIARVFDGGLTAAGRPYFVMEYVKGVPITEYCDAARLSVPQRLALFVQVCKAVQHAHQKGVIHRDLKPSNILVAPHDGTPVPKVIDFGLAKAMHQSLTEHTLHTAHGTIVGTPLYMAPEQAQLNNLDVDTRSDVYALGVLLYELLTGTTPLEKQRFKEAAWDEIRRVIREEEPPRPSARLSSADTLPALAARRQTEPARLTRLLRGELDWIAMKALEKDRTRRYETANAFAQDVERYMADEPVEARAPSARYRLAKFVKRNRGPVLAAVAVLLALVGGVVGTTWGLVVAERSRDEAVAAQRAEAERAAGERRAKEKALAAEKLAAERLTQVEAEQKRTLEQKRLAEDNEKKALEEKRVADAVRDFLQKKLLGQADATVQANALLRRGRFAAEADRNVTVRELLDRAAAELTPEKIEANFPRQPLLQAELLKTVGDAYRGVGEYGQAVAFLQRSAAMQQQHLGVDEPHTLVTLNNLGVAYLHAWKLTEAIRLLERVRDVQKKNLPPDHPDTLTTLNNLGVAYVRAGRPAEAIRLLEQVRDVRVKRLPLEHLDTLTTLTELAGAYMDAGRPAEAIKLYERVRDAQVKNFSPDHPSTLITLNNLAGAYQHAGKLTEAIQLLERVRDARMKLLGPDHPATLTTLNNLGVAYQDAGKLTEAIRLLERVRDVREKNLPPDHPDTLATLTNLAEAYLDARRLAEALQLLERVRDAQVKKLSPDHPDTLMTLNILARAYEVAWRLPEAIQLLERVRDVREKNLPPDHPDTLAALGNLARACQKAGRLPESIKLFEQIREVRERKLGLDHPATLATLNNLAGAYRAARRLTEAIRLFEQVRDVLGRKVPSDHPDTLATLNNLGVAYQAAGRLAESIKLFEQVRDTQLKKLSPDHPDTLATLGNLAAAYGSAKQLDKSIPLFEDVLKRREAKFGRGHPDTLNTLAQLGVSFRNAGRLDEALPILEEAHRKGGGHPSLSWVGAELLAAYLKSGKETEAVNLVEEHLAAARKRFGPDSPRLAGALAYSGKQLLDLKRYAAAEPMLREALALRAKLAENRQVLPWQVANAKSLLGGALLGQKKHKDAEPLLLAGYEGLKRDVKAIPPQGQRNLADAAGRLVALYEATDRKDEAAKWRKEMAAIRAAEKPAGP